jgi:hypothetical protein
MALGKRKPKQDELFIPAAKLATGPGHSFYAKLNPVLADAGFDEFVEALCAPYDVHPNTEGYRLMGESVDLKLFEDKQ